MADLEKQMPAEANNCEDQKTERPWASPRQEPVKGIVQPRIIPPIGKKVHHTNRLDYILTHTLKEAIKHKHVWPFLKPVDAVSLGIPNYHEKITRAMDLKTVESRIKNVYYLNSQECIDDIETVFNNCFTFNGPEDDVTIMAQNVHAVIKKSLESAPSEEHNMETTWGKKKKPKGGELARLAAGSEDRKKKEGSTVRMSEPPSECGSETSEKMPSGKMGSKTMKSTTKRKADSDDEEKNEPVRPHKREATTVKKTQIVNLTGRLRFCQKLLSDFFSKKYYDVAWVFYEPVNAEQLGLMDYHKIIKKPMDLGTIRKKLEGGEYSEPSEFEADIKLMLDNCLMYNPVGDPIHIMGERFMEAFYKRWKELPGEKSASSSSGGPHSHSLPIPPPLSSHVPSAPTAPKVPKVSHAPPVATVKPEIAEGSKSRTEDMMRLDNALAMLRERENKLKLEMRQLKEMEEKVAAVKRSRAEDTMTPFPERLLSEIRVICQPTSANPIVGASSSSGSKNHQNGTKKRNNTPYEFDSDSEEANTDLSYEAKRDLSMLINRLPVDCLCNIITIIERREKLMNVQQRQTDETEMEIDFEALGTKCLREMEAFAKHNLAKINANGGGFAIEPKEEIDEKKPEKQPMKESNLNSEKKKKESLPISESSESDFGRKRKIAKEEDQSESGSSSSSSEDDSEDDYKNNSAGQNRRVGMAPSREWNHRVGGMGGQPPMSRVPPPLPRNSSSSSSQPSQQQSHQIVKSKSVKSGKSKAPQDGYQANVSNAGKTILDDLIPEEAGSCYKMNDESKGSLPPNSYNSMEHNNSELDEENEDERIERLRMEARKAREREHPTSERNQYEVMTSFELEYGF